jgi:hypothetical protein
METLLELQQGYKGIMILSSVVDPARIRIQWDPKRAKLAHQNRKQLINFIF